MGRGKRLPLVAMRCQHLAEGGVEGTAVSCRELQGIGRNGEREEATVSCYELPEIYRNGGEGRGCRELP